MGPPFRLIHNFFAQYTLLHSHHIFPCEEMIVFTLLTTWCTLRFYSDTSHSIYIWTISLGYSRLCSLCSSHIRNSIVSNSVYLLPQSHSVMTLRTFKMMYNCCWSDIGCFYTRYIQYWDIITNTVAQQLNEFLYHLPPDIHVHMHIYCIELSIVHTSGVQPWILSI